jgi:hypothetical protein
VAEPAGPYLDVYTARRYTYSEEFLAEMAIMQVKEFR